MTVSSRMWNADAASSDAEVMQLAMQPSSCTAGAEDVNMSMMSLYASRRLMVIVGSTGPLFSSGSVFRGAA